MPLSYEIVMFTVRRAIAKPRDTCGSKGNRESLIPVAGGVIIRKSLVLLASLLPLTGMHANPTGGAVTHGSATIDRNGNVLTINQGTDRLIMGWQAFSIGQGETTRFVQPSSSSMALNRVTGGTRSMIEGRLEANGGVILINPAGITVTKSGVVNVNTFIGSTHDITDDEFLKGGALNFKGTSDASVENLGTIHAETGDIALIAHTVRNEGTLSARKGVVGLAAGDEVLYQPNADERLLVKSQTASASSIHHSGSIQAAAAEIKAAGNPYAVAINLDGIVEARGNAARNIKPRVIVHAAQGDIKVGSTATISASDESGGGLVKIRAATGNLQLDGKVAANCSIDNGGRGGEIQILGNHITLSGTALLDASGSTGGGKIFVGGDYQGGANPTNHYASEPLQNASTLKIDKGAVMNADATMQGDGGVVINWADGTTVSSGSVSVRGGPLGGNGGFVEISGKQNLGFDGAVDLTAPKGKAGQVLFDPQYLYIINDGDYYASLSLSDQSKSIEATAIGGYSGSTDYITGTLNASVFNNITGGTISIAATSQINFFLNSTIVLKNGVNLTATAPNITSWNGSSVTANGGTISINATTSFNNGSGSQFLRATNGGRWLVYSQTPQNNTFGGLDSGNNAIWGKTIDSTILETGNRYVFSSSPVGQITLLRNTKTYGESWTPLEGRDYTLNPINGAGAFTMATSDLDFSGVTVSLSSLGYDAKAMVGSHLVDFVSSTGGNITLAPGSSASLTITPAQLTVGLTNVTKVYDGTTAVVLGSNNLSLLGLVNGDSVGLLNTPTSAVYATNGAGSGILITANATTNLALSGPLATNYFLNRTSTISGYGTITPKTLTALYKGDASTVTKFYDGNNTATVAPNLLSLSGIIRKDDVSINSAFSSTYSDANTGNTKTVTVSGLSLVGDMAGNYTLASTLTGSGAITAKTLTASLTGSVSKVYDATTAATLTPANYLLSGIIGTDKVNLNNPAGGTFDNANSGSAKTISVSGLALDNANYQLESTSINGAIGTITPATLTASLTGSVSKVYDGTTAATLTPANYLLSGIIGTDAVKLNNPTSGTFDNANAGSGKSVSVTSLVLDNANYQLESTTINGSIGTITPATSTAQEILTEPTVQTAIQSLTIRNNTTTTSSGGSFGSSGPGSEGSGSGGESASAGETASSEESSSSESSGETASSESSGESASSSESSTASTDSGSGSGATTASADSSSSSASSSTATAASSSSSGGSAAASSSSGGSSQGARTQAAAISRMNNPVGGATVGGAEFQRLNPFSDAGAMHQEVAGASASTGGGTTQASTGRAAAVSVKSPEMTELAPMNDLNVLFMMF